MRKSLFLSVCGAAFLSFVAFSGAMGSDKPDWMQDNAHGRDIGVSHDGAQWFTGQDGKVYHWDAEGKSWRVHGTRSKFERIDAGEAGAAALTESGQLYVSAMGSDSWQPTGIRGADIGIGGGQIWVADAHVENGLRATLKGQFSATGKIDWQQITGRLTRIDVDPQGRAWGLDQTGRLFVYSGDEWIEDTKAPKGSDIGVGGDGSLYVIGSAINEELGGGRVYQRHAQSGEWAAVRGRLSAISVTPEGKPVGINSRNWVISGTMAPAVNLPTDETASSEKEQTEFSSYLSLSTLAGDKLELPDEIKDALIEPISGGNDTVSLGRTWLNGLETFIAVIKHEGSDIPTVALGHSAMRFTDYLPEARDTGFGQIGVFDTPVFLFVDPENKGKDFTAADFKLLKSFLGRDNFPEKDIPSGLHFWASADLNSWPNGQDIAAFLALKNKKLDVSGAALQGLFSGVEPRDTVPVSIPPEMTLDDLKVKYSNVSFEGARLIINLQSSARRSWGPLSFNNPVVEIAWAETLEFALGAGIDVEYAPSPSASSRETLTLGDARIVITPQNKSATIEGSVATDHANALIDVPGYEIGPAGFEGTFKIAENGNLPPKNLDDFEDFSFVVSGAGKLTTPEGKQKNIDMFIALEADEKGENLVPTLIVESDMTLADIVGSAVPGASKVVLSKFKASTDYMEGHVTLDGSPVRAVLYEPTGEVPIIGLEHESVDLGTYIPPIRNTSLGSFGLANALFFVRPESADKIIYNALSDVPEPLSPLLKKGDYTGLFPLTVYPGVTLVGTYDPASDGNASKVMAAYSIDENGYAVTGHFKLSQLKNLRFSKFDPRISIDKKAACEKVTNVILSGLDLSFPIPNFKPSYAGGSVDFNNASFSLKEIDGKIEPSILTGMTLKLPEKKAGISNIPMAAKLSVQGDLNILCNGVTTQTDGQIAVAASTALNADQVKNIAFDALARVTDTKTPNTETPDKNAADKAKQPKGVPDIGWKEPFGIPFLSIRQYASSGVFEQTEENGVMKRTLKTRTWTDSQLDRADLDLYGTMDFTINETKSRLDLDDWSFKAPGPIALNDLPGLKDFPKVDEFAVSDIDLTPDEMIGKLWRGAEDMEATAYFAREVQKGQTDVFSMFTRFESLKPHMIYDFLPSQISNVTFAPALIGWGNKDTAELKYQDAPKKLQPLLDGLIDKDGAITLAKGLTIGGKTAPEKIFNGRFTDLFKNYMRLNGDIALLGAFTKDDTGQMKGEMRAALEGLTINNIPEALIKFKKSELVLSNLSGRALEIKTTADVTFPEKRSPIEMSGSFKYEAPSQTENSFVLALTSPELWNNPFAFPDLQISNLGIEANFERKGEDTSQATRFVGDGVFRGQSGKVGISIAAASGGAADAVVSFEGSLKVSALMNVPAGASDIADATIRKLLISRNAIAGVMDVNIGGLALKDAKAAIIRDNGDAALFIRHDHDIDIGKMAANIPAPLNQISLPNGVLIVSSKSVPDFNAGDIPDVIYDEVLGGLTDDDLAHSLLVEDGLTFLTNMDVSKLPDPISGILASPFGVKGKVFIAGSVGGLFGGDPSLGLYTILKNVAPKMPPFLKELIAFKDGNVKIFIRKSKDNSDIDIGLSAAVKVKPRRLDDLSVQELDAILDLTYSARPEQVTPKITAGASVSGTWLDPMGLTGYVLKNPAFRFGKTAEGTVIEIHTERAEFKDGDQTKAFVFDMDSTWLPSVPPVPSSLALQFAKSCESKDKEESEIQACKDTPLILTPVTMARLQKSVFDLAFKSGSNLSGEILKQLSGEAKTTMEGFTKALSSAGDGMFSLIEKSPLSMIGVRDPVVYFGTPGSTPPRNASADIEYPPLGLGLYVGGDFIIDTGALRADLASGKYMVNLIDGYKVTGKITPPAPFQNNIFDVAGNMPLLGGKQSLRFTGALDIPTMPIPLFPLTGTFDMSRGAFTSTDASIYASVSSGDNSIKDLTTIEGGMSLTGRNLSFSMSLGECIPLEISADNIDLGNPETLAAKVAGSIRPSVPNPLDCALDLGQALLNMGEGAWNAGRALVTDPLGSGEALVDNAAELITNPGEALQNAESLATMPLNMAEMGAGMGISLVQTGLEKVPVLGPGAAQAVGEAFDKASDLKNAAMGALASNDATRWLSDGLGQSLGAVSGVAGQAIGAIGDWGSSVFGGDKQEAPVWYRINPLRCKPGFHYWNAAFKQCFEYGAVVLFDDATRQGNSIGDCMRVKYRSADPLTVEKCFGDTPGQFHLDPLTDQITSSWYSYYGYNGGWFGPGKAECLTRSGGANGKVFLDSCHKNGDNSKWTYTDDMKLQNGNECMTRNAANQVVMGNCASANKWLGTSVVPNWNEVEDIPMRGQIKHKSSGLCWYWDGGGPYKLKSCSTEDTSKRDDKLPLRSHTNLRVLDGHHTVEIMGSRAWDGQVNYACLGANAAGNAFGNSICHPDTQNDKNKWKVLAVNDNGTLDTGMNTPLKDTLKGEYVFKNVSTGTCLYVDATQANETAANPLRFSGNCVTNGRVTAQARFDGYEPDNLSQWVRILAQWREEEAFLDARRQLKSNIQQWQRWRIRRENDRIDQAFKVLQNMGTNTKVARFDRKSPGHCAHGTFWNENLKRCSKDSKLMLLYHDGNGKYKGCLRSEMIGTTTPGLWNDCNPDGESDAFLDVISFIFDDQGRIVKFNKDYQIKTKTTENEDGKRETFVVGTDTITSKDTCLMPTNSFQRIEGKQRVNFMYCGDDASQKWRYSQQGELISYDGQCLREVLVQETKSNITRSEVLRRTKENVDIYNAKIRSLKAERAKKGDAWYIPLAQAAVHEYDAGKQKLKDDIRNDVSYIDVPHLVLDNCQSDPMNTGKRRWLPSVGQNFTAAQGLPETAKITLANNTNFCVNGDMFLSGDITMQPCAYDNKNQYFAFGGVDETRFMISPRNSKTCLYDAGDDKISHGPCRSNGTQMFLRVDQADASVKLQNASSGKCLALGSATLEGAQNIVQMDCNGADSFKLQTVESLVGLTFADVGELDINPEKSAQWHAINEKIKARATVLYGGVYLTHGNAMLQKGAADDVLMAPSTQTVELERLPSHVMPSGETFFIPPVSVADTSIILIPGFEDGADHVTFAHGTSVQLSADGSIVPIADPYSPTYGNWFNFAHLQQVMRVSDAQGGLSFDYIDESPEFRQSATFKMLPALSGQDGMYSFQSLANPNQYLLKRGTTLIVGAANSAQASFVLEGASKWMKNDDMNLTDPKPPFRKTKPYFKNWKFPDTPNSVLNKNY